EPAEPVQSIQQHKPPATANSPSPTRRHAGCWLGTPHHSRRRLHDPVLLRPLARSQGPLPQTLSNKMTRLIIIAGHKDAVFKVDCSRPTTEAEVDELIAFLTNHGHHRPPGTPPEVFRAGIKAQLDSIKAP